MQTQNNASSKLITVAPQVIQKDYQVSRPDTMQGPEVGSLLTYYINLDERGSFYADVRNAYDKTVFEISGSDIFEDGFMADKHDLVGLGEYLVQLGIMGPTQSLISGDGPVIFEPIIAHGRTLGVDEFQGTAEEADLFIMALSNYGFLLKPVDLNVQRCSFAAFADVIEANYDLDNPQNDAVVVALRSLHERNS